jgi:hypothetical protein
MEVSEVVRVLVARLQLPVQCFVAHPSTLGFAFILPNLHDSQLHWLSLSSI